ncbi:transglycosylase SLT domain-containing protein [uncultured Alistipes sp.]|uniref:transglycosylase SLT domain-containing protein n=1 Tax=uncultured Alistipes sp. TaxID=538949 RepID=UPI0026261B80|nr:transglycosylase SLT domain-containing protein [uncultured Alistipes sp.]
MLKKTFLTFVFLTLLTSFYGMNATFGLHGSRSDIGRMHVSDSPIESASYTISIYDDLIRTVSEEEGFDWRLMSAIAYHESRFTPDIVSKQGAAGLMQIMPHVARQFNVSGDRIFDPETNVRLATQVLRRISSSLRFAPGTSEEDRMSIILASYNGGIGHVNDARRLARRHGENPDSWETVARYLMLKAQPEYYEQQGVNCGRFTGGRQTTAYVRDVMNRYDRYCRMTAR